MCVRYQADEKPRFSLTLTHALFCVPRMHPGPNAGEGKGLLLWLFLFDFSEPTKQGESLAWARLAAIGIVCLFVLIRTTLVLTFHGGGSCADPPLRILSALPSVPGAWRIGVGVEASRGVSMHSGSLPSGRPASFPSSSLCVRIHLSFLSETELTARARREGRF